MLTSPPSCRARSSSLALFVALLPGLMLPALLASCRSFSNADADSLALEHTVVVGFDARGGYRLGQGMASVSKVEIMLPREEGKEDRVGLRLPATQWAFLPERQALHVAEPVSLLDLDAHEIRVYGRRAVPWVLSAPADPGTHTISGFHPGSVRLLLDQREGVEGRDFEVDYEEGLLRFLKVEDCTERSHFNLFYALASDPAVMLETMDWRSDWRPGQENR